MDTSASDRAVELIREHVARTARPEVIGGIGGFAGLFDARQLTAYRRPVLATSTDGVGTKVMIASRLGRYDTVGIDLVAMVADDVVACGAEPLFLTDYVVCGAVVPERVAAIVSGVAAGCALAGCALLGGETAEHPGHLGPDDFDLAGAATGVAEGGRPARPGPGKARRRGDRDGLLRAAQQRVLAGPGGAGPRRARARTPNCPGWPGRSARSCSSRPGSTRRTACGSPAGVTCTPTRTSPAAAWRRTWPGSCRRALLAVIDRGSWRPPPVFGVLAARGRVAGDEMERVFNMGVGMVAVVAAEAADQAVGLLAARGVPAWLAGAGHPGISGATAAVAADRITSRLTARGTGARATPVTGQATATGYARPWR